MLIFRTGANIITYYNSGRSAGYGFVDFEDVEGATAAQQEMDKKELGSRVINVELARGPNPNRNKRRGRKNFGGNNKRRFRRRRPERIMNDNVVKSDTILHIANIPFATDEEALFAFIDARMFLVM